MHNVTVSKSRLMRTLRINRDNHRAIFLAAQDKYREKVIELLDRRLAEVRDGQPISLHFGLPEPVDYTSEYDAAISSLEWEEGETVVLDESSFRQLVLNEWRWAQHFAANSASYLAE